MLYLFDFDGTIVDSAPGVTKSAQVAMVRMGYPEYPIEKLRFFMGPPLNFSFREMIGMTEEEAEQAVVYFRERYREMGKLECSVYPGIPALLEKVKHAGHKIAVASAKPEPFVREIMDHFGILGYFDCVVGASMDEKMSDKANNIRRAMDGTGFGECFDGTWMIGDRKYDMEGAKEVGIKAIGVLYGYGTREELESTGADMIAATVKDLEGILLQA